MSKGKGKAKDPGQATTHTTIPIPPQIRQTTMLPYRTGDLAYGRVAVVHDLGHVNLAPLDYFRAVIFPSLHKEIDMNKIMRSLRGAWYQPHGHSAGFQTPPKRLRAHEDKAFKPEKSKVIFRASPTKTPVSERTNTARPDAYLAITDKKSIGEHADAGSWDDILVSFEFKKNDRETDRKDVSEKYIFIEAPLNRCGRMKRNCYGA